MNRKDHYKKLYTQAVKDGERSVGAYTGRTPSDTLSDLTANLPAGQIWVRINGMASPYAALYQSPDTLLPNTAVKVVFDIEADKWVITSINASAVIYDNGGTAAPTFAVQEHDHLTTGGTLGDNTVGSGQIIAGAVGATEIDADAIDATHISNLTLATVGRLRQEASNSFSTIKDNLTATTDPTAGDDDVDGYVVLSFWLNTTTPELFFCADNSTGAANWMSLTSAGNIPDNTITRAMMTDDSVGAEELWGLTSSINAYLQQNSGGSLSSLKFNTTGIDPTAGDDSGDGYSQRSYWFNTADRKWFLCWSNALGSAVWAQITGDDHIATADIQDDAIIPTKLNGLSGATTAIVAQTASNVFTTIPYTLTTDTRLFYDGTIIRKAYAGQEVSNTTGLTTSGTTEADVIEITIADTDINNTSTLEIGYEYRCYGTVVGDLFTFRLYYYNGSGYTAVAMSKVFQTLVSGNIAVFNYTWLVDQSALGTAPDVNGSSNYLWKITVQRSSGTGNLFIYRGPDVTLLRVKEV